MLTMFGKALFGLFKSNGGKIRKVWITVLPTAFAVVFALPAVAQASVTGPFTFGSFTDVCAAYHGFEGNPAGADCNATQSAAQFTSTFNPSQVSESGSPTVVNLAMNSAATVSGAVSTEYHLTPPLTLSAQVNLPCNASADIYNWPAVWLESAGDAQEIDIAEGDVSGGAGLTWTYWWTDPTKGMEKVYGQPSGNWCGMHTYSINWSSSAVTITWDSRQVADVTTAQTGGDPLDQGPMWLNIDYADGKYGLTQGGETMAIDNLTCTAGTGGSCNTGG